MTTTSNSHQLSDAYAHIARLENAAVAAAARYQDALWAMRRVPKGAAYLPAYRAALGVVSDTYHAMNEANAALAKVRGAVGT